MNPFAAIALVLATLTALIGVVALLNRGWPAELSRKAIHVGMGLVCLSFPWLFQESWPVVLLAIFAVTALLSIRCIPFLHRRFGHILGGVCRSSWGEIYFPIAVAAVFAAQGKNNLLFIIPVLQLTVADAVGALIGIRYGVHHFQTDDGQKSAEGSSAFLLAAFLATFLPLQISGFPLQVSIPISLLLGLILMLMEAISWRGLDNLFLPLTCQVVLLKVLPLSTDLLMRDLFLLLAVIALIALWRRRTHLSRSAGIATGLVLYVSWLLGGWPWLLGPAATLAGYSLLCLKSGESPRHLVHAVFAVAAPGLFWLYLANASDHPSLIYPYGLAYAANFGMISAAFFLQKTPRFPLPAGILCAVALAFILHAAPYVIVWQIHPNLLALTLTAFGLLLVVTALFVRWQPQIRQCPSDAARWCRQASLAVLASVAGAVIIRLFQPWTRSLF